MAKKFTVLVCTYNQCESLSKVLGFLSQQIVYEPSNVEVIVVDNNSNDATKSVCDKILASLPFPSRYVFESVQGVSVARNTGVCEAAGDVIIFTDDDARIPSNWLQAHIDSYDQYDADCVFGRIRVDWDMGKPKWYSDNFGPMFVALDYGDVPLNIRDMHHEFYGKNFSLKKEVLVKLGGFDVNLGRKGTRLFLGEETRIYRGLVKEGYSVCYAPEAIIYHMLKEYEYTEAHCLRHSRDAMLSDYYMMRTSAGRKMFKRPLYALKKSGALLRASFTGLFDTTLNRYPRYFYARVMLMKSCQLLKLWFLNGSARYQ